MLHAQEEAKQNTARRDLLLSIQKDVQVRRAGGAAAASVDACFYSAPLHSTDWTQLQHQLGWTA